MGNARRQPAVTLSAKWKARAHDTIGFRSLGGDYGSPAWGTATVATSMQPSAVAVRAT